MADSVERDNDLHDDVNVDEDINVKDDKGNAPEAATDTKDFNDAQTLRFTVDVLYDKDVKRRASTLSIVDVIERAVNGATLHLSATNSFRYEVVDGDQVTELAEEDAKDFADKQAADDTGENANTAAGATLQDASLAGAANPEGENAQGDKANDFPTDNEGKSALNTGDENDNGRNDATGSNVADNTVKDEDHSVDGEGKLARFFHNDK